MIECYFDGCCEPTNPGGTAAFGAVIFKDGERIWDCSRIFRPIPGREKETSNNVAEYSGFIAILEYLIEHGLQRESILIRGDSNLVIQQMFGTRYGDYVKKWRIKAGLYVPVAHKAGKLLGQFPRTKGQWIPREENSIADELSKCELIQAGIEFRIQPN